MNIGGPLSLNSNAKFGEERLECRNYTSLEDVVQVSFVTSRYREK